MQDNRDAIIEGRLETIAAEYPERKKQSDQNKADIDFIAMMTDVPLEPIEEDE